MKKTVLLFTLFLSLFSCKKEQSPSELDKSLLKFNEFKKTNHNNYLYKVTSSSWTGYRSYTTIEVADGMVVGRHYEAYQTYPRVTLISSWEENQNALNTHSEGAESLTLDQIYDKASTVWLKADKSQNQIIFEARNDGMISRCGFIPNKCVDDCFFGVFISEIKAK